ncbi:receptor protein kinase TMK1 [Pyrus ussuriensis x Pyrus communis]|uniref:non-specific serine/threonine protein kinase n=1 Tax=Pyrus ussuriensis x Pyrus communis TaxID=2448454 RepID=A0A5N5H9L7_9ROSA|nr:receptor protein kinase TMK1 [Pyrus ussuriensis x Pyrus communis]
MGKQKILQALILALSLLLLVATAPTAADDSDVMSKLAAGLSPAPKGWSTSTAYCSWDGVNCDTSKRVTSINLASKGLSGSLPSNLNSLSQLTTLSLQSNSLSGAFPSLANLSSLQEVYLDTNNFTSIPAGCFTGLSSLQILSMSQNINLDSWVFPSELTEASSLVTFAASNVNLYGSLPDVFDSFPNLQNLRLSYNNFTGPLSKTFSGSGIQNLWVNNQVLGLSGTVEVLANMTQLSQVWLQKNQFTGPIPDLSKCETLFDLQLRDNQFTGIVPATLMSISSLKNVSLDNNKLQGPMPAFGSTVEKSTVDGNSFCQTTPGTCDPLVTTLLEVAGAFGYPVLLADSWTGNKPCSGWSFIVCDPQGKVFTVNFDNKHFNGTISPAFANLTSLKNLVLSRNNLVGSIPDSLLSLTQLQLLDVSNNNLSGAIPKFPSTVKLVTTGNVLIGTTPSTGGGGGTPSGTGSNGTTPSGSPAQASNGPSVSPGMIAGIVIAVVIFVVVVLFVSYKCYASKKHKKFGRVANPLTGIEIAKSDVMSSANGYNGVTSELQSQSSGDLHVFEGGNVAISIQVLRQVTNNFSEDNILGRGGFGIVYKGELHDGTKIAVKRMESVAVGTKGLNEFQAEIAVLTKVRHRHLVALLGSCINGNERLLVYEYMPQGTLTQHLFEWREIGVPPLTWKQRVTIALDVARGVEYLHSLAQQSFIHRDLKPSNILLGDDMRAKVADFGLVKNAPDGKYSVETRLAGTFGYLAPEYAATGRVTTKVDVYAFGVVLMELISGRKALDDTMPDERSHLVSWFRRVLVNKENIPKAIDQTLDPDEETMESIYKVAELAGYCTAREPYQRPDMGHAVNILGPLVEHWKPTTHEEENSGIDLHMSLPQALQRWQANEGTSRMFDDMSFSQTQSSIPSKPSGFADSFDSMDCR